MEENRNTPSPFVIGALFAILCGLAGLSYYAGQQQLFPNQSNSSPASSPSPQASPVADISFTDTESGLSLKYPGNWEDVTSDALDVLAEFDTSDATVEEANFNETSFLISLNSLVFYNQNSQAITTAYESQGLGPFVEQLKTNGTVSSYQRYTGATTQGYLVTLESGQFAYLFTANNQLFGLAFPQQTGATELPVAFKTIIDSISFPS